jgi:hypothetical protein
MSLRVGAAYYFHFLHLNDAKLLSETTGGEAIYECPAKRRPLLVIGNASLPFHYLVLKCTTSLPKNRNSSDYYPAWPYFDRISKQQKTSYVITSSIHTYPENLCPGDHRPIRELDSLQLRPILDAMGLKKLFGFPS